MTEFQEGIEAGLNLARKDAPPEVQLWLDSLPRGRSDYIRSDGTRLARTDNGRFYPTYIHQPRRTGPFWGSSSEERFG